MLRARLFLNLALALALPSLALAAPLQIYILAGQSNMEGHARVSTLDHLSDFPETKDFHQAIKTGDDYHAIPNTYISYLTGEKGNIRAANREVSGPLTIGFGSQGGRDYDQPYGEKIGPELAFGYTMQKALGQDQNILLIKAAWGGQSLAVNFRAPSSGPYPQTEANANKFDTEEKRAKIEAETGLRYRQLVDHVKLVLNDLPRVVPDYDASQGYELAGFAWFQGFNDLVDRGSYPERDKPGGYQAYADGLAHLIRDLRRDLKTPDLPFAIGVLGVGGPVDQLEPRYQSTQTNFRSAMAAPASMPEFQDSVVAVLTEQSWESDLSKIDKARSQIRSKANSLRKKNKDHENADGSMSEQDIRDFLTDYENKVLTPEMQALAERGVSNQAYHYMGSSVIYSRIGIALAEALLELDQK